jgi:hypothetical protein
MKTQGVCPACKGTLTFWAGFKAMTPFTIRCPQCKARLKVVFPRLGLIFTVIVVCFLGAEGCAATLLLTQRMTTMQFLALNGGLVVAWLALEIVLGILLFTYASFVPRQKEPFTANKVNEGREPNRATTNGHE